MYFKIPSISRRVQKETERLVTDPIPGIVARPDPSNPYYFSVKIAGPVDTPYEGGVFQLEMFLTEDYPIASPKLKFLTKVYHPNVDPLGRICLELLTHRWSPALQIKTALISIQNLLSFPDLEYDVINHDIASHWKQDENGAKRTAREWCYIYAST